MFITFVCYSDSIRERKGSVHVKTDCMSFVYFSQSEGGENDGVVMTAERQRMTQGRKTRDKKTRQLEERKYNDKGKDRRRAVG